MNKPLHLLLILMGIFATCCQENKECQHLPWQCNFIKDKGVIETNEQSEYDIIPEVSTIITGTSVGLGIRLKIFNYGGSLHINPYAIENIYSATYVPNNNFYIVNPKDIRITQINIDDTYGSWGKGSVVIPQFGKYYNDVFISPLAYKFLNSGSVMDDNAIVLVRLIDIDNNSCFNGLFIGDHLTEYIINDYYPYISNNHHISHGSKNHWPLWEPLMTEKEYEKIRDRYKTLSLFGTEQPSHVTDIINKYLNR